MSGPSLRVGIDGRAFTSPAGGVRRYVSGLVEALMEVDPALQCVAVGADLDQPLPAHVEAYAAASRLPTNFGWSVDGLPRACRRLALDLFHAPAYTAPLWGVHPLVLTIHDVSYERHPEWYPYQRDPFRRWFYRRSARTADVIVTDSEFSRGEIEAAYGIAADRVRVVPLGVGAPFTDRCSASPPEPPLRPFILHVGDLHPRRNVALLVDVLKQLHELPGMQTLELVLVGADRGSRPEIAAKAKLAGIEDSVRFVGPADDAATADLLRRAAVMAYPSLYEGFGLPPLEAMACGTPVVASRAASIPEVVGDAGVLLDPRDAPAWREAIVAVLSSPSRAGEMRDAGLKRAAAFSWRRTAERTLEIYHSAAAHRRRGTA